MYCPKNFKSISCKQGTIFTACNNIHASTALQFRLGHQSQCKTRWRTVLGSSSINFISNTLILYQGHDSGQMQLCPCLFPTSYLVASFFWQKRFYKYVVDIQTVFPLTFDLELIVQSDCITSPIFLTIYKSVFVSINNSL